MAEQPNETPAEKSMDELLMYARTLDVMRMMRGEPRLRYSDDPEPKPRPPSKNAWRSQTQAQGDRNQAMIVIEPAEFEEYKQWVTDYRKCDCGTHVGMNFSGKNVMVITMILGFLDDERIAELDGNDNSVPFGFGPNENPMDPDACIIC